MILVAWGGFKGQVLFRLIATCDSCSFKQAFWLWNFPAIWPLRWEITSDSRLRCLVRSGDNTASGATCKESASSEYDHHCCQWNYQLTSPRIVPATSSLGTSPNHTVVVELFETGLVQFSWPKTRFTKAGFESIILLCLELIQNFTFQDQIKISWSCTSIPSCAPVCVPSPSEKIKQ